MTFKELKAYFQGFAASNLVLQDSPEKKSFIAVHSDKGADDFIKTCKSPTIMILVTPDKKLLPPKGENYNWDKYVVFFILRKCGRAAETVITDAQSDCEEIVDDFVTQMVNNFEFNHKPLVGLVQDSIVVQPVGPMADDFYGQACIFTLIDNFNWFINPNKWAGAPPDPLPPVSGNTGDNIIVDFGDENLSFVNGDQTYTANALVGKTGYAIFTTQMATYFRPGDLSYDSAAGSFTILVPGFILQDGDMLIIFPNRIPPD